MATAFLQTVLAGALLMTAGVKTIADDWPMLGRDNTRNSVSLEKNPPMFWDVGKGVNIKWTADLGTWCVAQPVVSGGLVWIGTNNEGPRNEKPRPDASVLMCFRESDGKLLYQYVSPRLPTGRADDYPYSPIGCSPLIEGDRLWFTTNRCETVCLDIGPLLRGEGNPEVAWKFDMREELNVDPHGQIMFLNRSCSIASHENWIYVTTNNGVDASQIKISNPEAPSLVCFNKHNGTVVWTDNSPGENILKSQCASPLVVEIEGKTQVIVPQGDGWVRSFTPEGDGNGGSKLIWKFDMNRKESKWIVGGRGDRNNILATPVYYEERIYIASGHEPEHGIGPGRLCCIDPTKTGDISSELAVDKEGKPLPHRRLQVVDPEKGEQAIPNPNSGLVWEFGGLLQDAYDKLEFEDQMHRTISSVAIHKGLVIASDIGGAVHCLDANTGQQFWGADLFAGIWSSPLIVDDKAYVFDRDGDVAIFPLSRDPAKAVKKGNEFPDPVTEFEWGGGQCDSSPAFANGVLFIATTNTLNAIHNEKQAAESSKEVSRQTQGDWPQWRGPNRDNKSTETGLLKEWPEQGPPLVWKLEGLGEGIGSVSVAGGRIFTTGQHDEKEYVIALDEKTGRHLWTSHISDTIPQSRLMRWLSQRTPTIDGERLYILTSGGDLICLRCRDGSELWRKNYLTDFAGRKGWWGYCDFPLVDGERLICVPGGTEASVVALNKLTGESLWKTYLPENTAGYAATQIAALDGVRQYVVVLNTGLFGISPKSGHVLWSYERLAGRQNSLTPLVRGDEIFCASAYRNKQIALLKLASSGTGMHVQEKYLQREGILNHFQDTLVRVGDHIYADSRRFGLTCLNWDSGEMVSERKRSRGMRAILFAGDRLYVRGSDGVVELLEPDPEQCIEKGRFSIPDHLQSVGATHPVIAAGRLYLRDNDNLFCYNVREDAFQQPRPDPETIVLTSPENQPAQDRLRERIRRKGVNRAPDSIFLPTPQDVVAKMLKTANVKKTDVLYDLGSGDGRIVMTAAEKFGCRACGVELDGELVKASQEEIKKKKLQKRASIERKDMFTVDLSRADVVTVFQYSRLLEKLMPQFAKMKPGSRIVSHQFEIPDVEPQAELTVESKETGNEHRILLYRIPLKKKPAEPDR